MGRRVLLAWAVAAVACSGSNTAPTPKVERPVPEVAPKLDVGEAEEPPEDAEPAPSDPPPKPDTWIQAQLEAHPDKFGALLEEPDRFRLQILVSLIEDATATPPVLEEHGFRVGAEFIYPASSIKVFASIAAMRKLQTLREGGAKVGLRTPVALCKNASKRCTETADPTNLDGGVITLGHEIRKMQLVSDNIAFNRLYNFVGHRDFNEMVWELGFPEVRVHHRMFDSEEAKVRRTTPRMELRPKRGKRVVVERRISDLELPPTPAARLRLGTAHLDKKKNRVEEPLSFEQKNYASVRDLHRVMVALTVPGADGAVDLGLTPEHRSFLLDAMTEDPHDSQNPVYTEPHHSGLRYKTMIRGMMRAIDRSRLRYVNKPGRAFGFHLDTAYIEDRKTHRAMVVTTVVYANADGVLNDNTYEYDEVTRPYLKNLGEVLVRAWLLER